MNGRSAVLLVWVDDDAPESVQAAREYWEATARSTGVPLLVLVRGTTSVVYTGPHEQGQRGSCNE